MIGTDTTGVVAIGSLAADIYPQSSALNEAYVVSAIRGFLLSILPSGIEIVKAQINRVPEPTGADFVVMTPIRRSRFATNFDSYSDCTFIGNIAGTTLTVTQTLLGSLNVGATVFGTSIIPNTMITGFGTSPNAYVVSQSQNVASELMAAGQAQLQQATEFVVQLDVHGPNSGDNSEVITTAFRDDYAVTWMATNWLGVEPLYADEARQMPFENDQQQIEYRWVIDTHLEYDPVIALPQQFASALKAHALSVQSAFPQ